MRCYLKSKLQIVSISRILAPASIAKKKELDCLQCLNKVKRWSLFVFAWNFTKRAKICAHFQIRLQLKIWEHLKILLSKRVTEKHQFGCKFNPGWKRAIAKDGKVVWFYILVFAQSPHIHQLERTKRFISCFSLGFNQKKLLRRNQIYFTNSLCFSDSQTLFSFSNIWVNCLFVVWKWVSFFSGLFHFPIIVWHLVQTLPGKLPN